MKSGKAKVSAAKSLKKEKSAKPKHAEHKQAKQKETSLKGIKSIETKLKSSSFHIDNRFKKFNLGVIEKNSEFYADFVENRLPQYQLTKFVTFLPSKAKVLVVGCAAGRDARYLTEEGYEVFGVDISKSLIAEAKKRAEGKSIKFEVMDLEALKFPDKSFDAVWCYNVLNFLPKEEMKHFFDGLGRILKTNGTLFVNALESDKGESEHVLECFEVAGEKLYHSYYTQFEIEEQLMNSGFEILNCVVFSKEIEAFARKIR